MNLSQDDKIIGATRISPNDSAEILCITRNGYGKRSDFDEYRKIKRGGKGCKTMNINEKTGKIVEAMYVEKIDDIILMTKQGQTIRVAISDIRKTGRVASGVIIMKLPTNDDITQAIRIIPDEQDEE
jgi:DNA gyrase subunit A